MVATRERQRNWIDAPEGYAVALDGERVVARSPKGAELKMLPAALKDAAVIQQLRELREWLGRHERECASSVEAWMVRSLPVPGAVVAAVCQTRPGGSACSMPSSPRSATGPVGQWGN